MVSLDVLGSGLVVVCYFGRESEFCFSVAEAPFYFQGTVLRKNQIRSDQIGIVTAREGMHIIKDISDSN